MDVSRWMEGGGFYPLSVGICFVIFGFSLALGAHASIYMITCDACDACDTCDTCDILYDESERDE